MVIKSVIKNYSLVALHYYSDNKNKHILISCFYSTFIIWLHNVIVPCMCQLQVLIILHWQIRVKEHLVRKLHNNDLLYDLSAVVNSLLLILRILLVSEPEVGIKLDIRTIYMRSAQFSQTLSGVWSFIEQFLFEVEKFPQSNLDNLMLFTCRICK